MNPWRLQVRDAFPGKGRPVSLWGCCTSGSGCVAVSASQPPTIASMFNVDQTVSTIPEGPKGESLERWIKDEA